MKFKICIHFLLTNKESIILTAIILDHEITVYFWEDEELGYVMFVMRKRKRRE